MEHKDTKKYEKTRRYLGLTNCSLFYTVHVYVNNPKICTMLLTIIIFFLINVTLAQVDSRLIGKGRIILHFMNAIVYSAMCYIPYKLFDNYWLIGLLFVERLLVFNISLSVFRKKKWYYISPERKAVTDKIAFFFFGYKGKLMYAVYIAAFILLICKIYLW